MSREQTQNKIYFNANSSLRQQRKSPFIAKTVQHWYFTANVQNVRRLQKHTSTETLTPLLDSVVDDVLVHALPLQYSCSDALSQLIQSPGILSVECRRVPGARSIHDSLPDLDPDC